MTNKKLLFGLLLTVIAMTSLTSINAYASLTTPSAVSVVSVVGTTLTYTCTDATYGMGESFLSTVVDIVETATILSPTACDGSSQTHDISSLSDLTTYTLRVTSTGNGGGGFPEPFPSVATAFFTTLDFTDPVITPNAITDPYELENFDSYVEGCTATDNDPTYVDNCSVQSGSIDTSILGLQSVTYEATDPSGNMATSTVTSTIVDTTAPVITLVGINPETVFITIPYVDAGATISDNDNSVDGSVISCDASAVDVNTAGSYLVLCDFVDPSGNPAVQVTRTVNVVDNIAPVITLAGANPQIIGITDPYVELGATASDVNDGDITANIVIDSSAVDVNTAGSYIVTYDVSDSAGNPAIQITRTVDVVDDIAPVITLVGANPQTVFITIPYVELGATASDVNDGDITANIVIDSSSVDVDTFGTYFVTYDVSDLAGNPAIQVVRTVNVVDNIAPVITLLGDATVDIAYASTYVDAGATASDVNDGDITANIVTVNPVDATQENTSWLITYDVSDASGNNAIQVTRTVNVGNSPSGNDDAWKSKPTFGTSHVGQSQIVDEGFSMDGKGYTLTNNWHTPFEKITINTGEIHNFKLKAQSSHGIKNMKFALVPAVGKMSDAELTIEVKTNCNGGITNTNVFQEKVLIDASRVSTSLDENRGMHTLKINGVSFLDQPFFEVVGIEATDCRNRVQTTFLNEGIDVIGESFVEPETIMIPIEGKIAFNDPKMQELTRIDKFTDTWANENGILYTKNEYDTWMKITPDEFVRNIDQAENVMTRQNSNYGLIIDYEKNRALNTAKELFPDLFDEESFAEIHNIKIGDSVDVRQREITMSKLSWNNSN